MKTDITIHKQYFLTNLLLVVLVLMVTIKCCGFNNNIPSIPIPPSTEKILTFYDAPPYAQNAPSHGAL